MQLSWNIWENKEKNVWELRNWFLFTCGQNYDLAEIVALAEFVLCVNV